MDIPAKQRYFEDYVPGSVYEFGARPVGEEEIIEYARKYDPQIFHIDPDSARRSPFGGVVASGWHTAGMAMRLLVDNYLPHGASAGSPGVDELRWHKPVRPGDVLSVRVTILEARPSKTKYDRGIIRTHVEVLNQRREVVTSWKGMAMMLRRDESLHTELREEGMEYERKKEL
jgi:acyl dehydratase